MRAALLAALLAYAGWLGYRSWAAPTAEVPLPWVEVRPSLSRDGRVLAFTASRAALAEGRAFGPRDGLTDVLVWDGKAVVNLTADADGSSTDPFVAPDGLAVAFASEAANLVPADENRAADVFLWSHGGLRRIPPPVEGLADGSSFSPVLAAGRLAFVSTGVPRRDGRSVVLLDPLRVLPGRPLGPVFGRPSLTASSVAYASFRDWAVGEGRRGLTDILLSPAVEEDAPLSLTPGADGPSYSPSLVDGLCAFTSLASNLVPGDTNGQFDIFVRDLATGRMSRESEGLDEGCFEPSLSEDGRWLAFSAYVDGVSQVFLRDRRRGTAARVAAGYNPCVSGDGRSVAFASRAEGGHVYLFGRESGRVERIPVR